METHWAEPGKCCQVSPEPCNGRPVIQNPLLKGLLCACLPWFQWLLPCTRDFSPETCHESPMVALFLSIPGYAEGCHYPLFPSLSLLYLVSSVTQSCTTLWDLMDCSTPGLPVHHNSRSLIKLMSIRLVTPSNHLIPCHPLLLLTSIFPSIRVFSNESVLQVAKVLEFQL